MANLIVEGDWKEFTFHMAKEEDYPKILEHLRNNFYRDEPINRYMGQGQLKTKDMDAVTIKFLDEGISFFAIHKPSGKMAGARIMGIANKGDEDDTDESIIASVEAEESKNLLPNFFQMRAEANIYERMGVDKYGDFLFVSVDKEFRGQGLATEMYERALKLMQYKGMTVVESLFSNPFSHRIAKRLGFVEVSRKYLKDYKALDGSPLFPMAEDDEVTVMMIKTLS